MIGRIHHSFVSFAILWPCSLSVSDLLDALAIRIIVQVILDIMNE